MRAVAPRHENPCEIRGNRGLATCAIYRASRPAAGRRSDSERILARIGRSPTIPRDCEARPRVVLSCAVVATVPLVPVTRAPSQRFPHDVPTASEVRGKGWWCACPVRSCLTIPRLTTGEVIFRKCGFGTATPYARATRSPNSSSRVSSSVRQSITFSGARALRRPRPCVTRTIARWYV